MEMNVDDVMKIVKQLAVVDGDESGEDNATVKDPVQQFIDDMEEEREKKLQDFNAKQQDLNKAAEVLCEMSDEHGNYITITMNLLRELGRITGVVDDNSNGSHNEGFTAVCSYISKITSNFNAVIGKCKILEHEREECLIKVFELREDLTKRQEKDKLMEQRSKYLDAMIEYASDLEHQNADKEKDLDCMRYNIELLKNAHQKEVAELKKEISEKENKLKEMQEEADKAEKIKKLKRMNEERVMSRKELEDLEDAVSKEIKTLQMRKLFVQGMHAKVKPVVPEDDKQREVIEKSLSTSMENMKSLNVEIGRIQKIVQQNSTRH